MLPAPATRLELLLSRRKSSDRQGPGGPGAADAADARENPARERPGAGLEFRSLMDLCDGQRQDCGSVYTRAGIRCKLRQCWHYRRSIGRKGCCCKTQQGFY